MLLLDGDHGNLNARIVYQSRRLNRGTRGLRIRHRLPVCPSHPILPVQPLQSLSCNHPVAKGKALAAGKIDVLMLLGVAVRTGD